MSVSRLRVLFYDDDLDTREMTCILLGGEGFDVVCPETSKEVLELARREQFDAYVLDNWMPDMSGLEICRAIRDFNVHTPVIFYSAAAFEQDRAKALASGAQAYVTKPGTVAELAGAIRSAIKADGLGGDEAKEIEDEAAKLEDAAAMDLQP